MGCDRRRVSGGAKKRCGDVILFQLKIYFKKRKGEKQLEGHRIPQMNLHLFLGNDLQHIMNQRVHDSNT